jgi:hypothetical protein
MRMPALLLVCAFGSSAAVAQSDPIGIRDDVPVETYLTLLAQVAAPARDGAEAYMSAFRSRCGRAMRGVELRRAFAEGNGDPTLMAMIRASHEKDSAALQRLGTGITCPRS